MVLLASGCGASIENARETPVAEALGIGIDRPCEISRAKGVTWQGFMHAQPSPQEELSRSFISGKKSRNGLPRLLRFEETTIRRLTNREDARGLSGGHNSKLLIKDGFVQPGFPPSVFALAYQRKDISYVGPLVVGQSPSEQELDLATEAARLEVMLSCTLWMFQKQGLLMKQAHTKRDFHYRQIYIRVGNTFLLTDILDDGALTLGFSGLAWDQLYSCAARIVSSGQGGIELRNQRVLENDQPGPFETAISEGAIDAVFEAVLFAPMQRPAAPNRVGGVFLVYAGDLILRAVFLSDELDG